MLSSDSAHLLQRSRCVERFARAYGTMPLRAVEFRVDPLLYKVGLFSSFHHRIFPFPFSSALALHETLAVLRSCHFFVAAPALKVRGLGADSGSDQIGSAPTPGKKGGSRRHQLHTLTFLILSYWKVNY